MKYFWLCSFISISIFGFSQNSKNMNLFSTWESDSATKYNDIWGYTANGREYAILGSNWGTHFIDVTNPLNLTEISSFEGNANDVTWRDFKIYQTYAYGVADGDSNSLQIFDLQYLPDSVVKVTDEVSLAKTSHNIFIEQDRIYFASHTYASGSSAVSIYSLADPENPTPIKYMDGSYFGGYALHDIFVKNNIAYCSAGYGGLFIYDLKNVNSPILLGSITVYPDQGYNHSSWLSDNNSTLVVADEVPSGMSLKLFDISDLNNIEFLSMFESHDDATPHNPFIIDNNIYVSYYMDGVQIFNYSNVFNVEQVAYYDTYIDNGNNYIDFGPYEGCWGIYPFLPSKNIIASDIKYGLNILSANLNQLSNIDENSLKNDIKIHPNPTETTINIQNIKEYSHLNLQNSLGQTIYTFDNTLSKNTHKINISSLNAGIYFLNLKNKTQSKIEKINIK